MPDTAHFLFTGNDVHKITSLEMDDVGPASGVPAGTWQLKFRLSDPGPAQVRPLLAGTLLFVADPAASGVLPDAAAVTFAPGSSGGWKTVGRLAVTVTTSSAGLAPDLPVKPNWLWYWPVAVPEGFLFDTLRSKLAKGVVPTAGGDVRPSRADWAQHAVAEFLAGRYALSVTDDDIERWVMPTVVEPAPDGVVELLVASALAQKPKDAPEGEFDDPANPVDAEDPTHPRQGPIPAREVYRRYRPHMPAEAAAEPLRNLVLAAWPAAPRFFPVRFTRIWEPGQECSVHLPRQTVRFRAGGAVVQEHSLPAHGVVFVRQQPAANPPHPGPPTIDVDLTGGTMRWLRGEPTSWRRRGRTDVVAIDLAAVADPHVVVRLPMTAAMLSDTTRPQPGGGSCTYLSLRREVRALVDNRIAGGRLSFGVDITRPDTQGIIARAFAGTTARVNHVANNAPDPDGNPDLLAPDHLLPILLALFPDLAPQTSPGGAQVLREGEVTYHLWQSRADRFQAEATKRNFDPDHIGRGSAGAMVDRGLAAYHVDPLRRSGEADNAYFDRVVGETLAGLTPGALVQFWHESDDFEHIKSRVVTFDGDGDPEISYGHSPVFEDYVRDGAGNITGLRLIDQWGTRDHPIGGAPGNRRLTWRIEESDPPAEQEIWITANWVE